MSFLYRILQNLPHKKLVFKDTVRHISSTQHFLHKTSIKDGPGLEHFIANSLGSKNPELIHAGEAENIPYLQEFSGGNQRGKTNLLSCSLIYALTYCNLCNIYFSLVKSNILFQYILMFTAAK